VVVAYNTTVLTGGNCLPPRNFTDDEEAEIARLYLGGLSARAIATGFGLRFHVSILAALRRQGVVRRSSTAHVRRHGLREDAFAIIADEPTAYWWGFIYADGYVHRRSLIMDLQKQDRPHVEALRLFLRSEKALSKVGRLEANSLRLASDLRRLGIVPYRPKIPDFARLLPRRLRNHFLRGLFDGDGSARASKSLALCGSVALMRWSRAVLAEEAGTNPRLAISQHRSGLAYLYFSGRLVALRVADYLYSEATIWMPRKRARIDGWR